MSRIFAAFMLICLVVVGGAALAQDMPPVYCGDLTAADCQLLKDSQAAMGTLNSNRADFTMNLNIEGMPDEPASVRINLSGAGSYTGGDALRALSANAAAAQTDPMAAINLIVDVLAAFDGDLTLKIGFPPELITESGMPESITLELKLVDGIGYINFDPLQPLINDPSFVGWGGLDLVGLIRAILEQQGEALSGMLSQGFAEGMAMGMNPELIAAMSDPAYVSSFMSIVRTDSGAADMATFVTTIDMGALMSSPAFMQMMQEQMRAQMEMQGTQMTEAEMQQAMQMVEGMFQNVAFTISQTIGVNDKFVHSTDFSMAFDMASVMAQMGETGAAPKFSIDASIRLSQFNDVAPITAPANASVMPYQQLLSMMGMMAGAGAAPQQ